MQQLAHKARNVVFAVKHLMKFVEDGEVRRGNVALYQLFVKNIAGNAAFEHHLLGDIIRKETFADKQPQRAVAAQVVERGQRVVADAAIVDQRLFDAAYKLQDSPQIFDCVGENHKLQVGRFKLRIDHTDDDGVDVFEDAQHFCATYVG